MAKITKICSHHTGPINQVNPLSSSAGITESQINNAHKARDFNLSALGWYVGYNLVIYRDGSKKQYRLLGEQTAAATGSNFNTFHICIVGNFTSGVDAPTAEQVATLTQVIRALIDNKPETVGIKVAQNATFNFTAYNIFPHRILQPNHTSCHGSLLDDNFGRNIAFEYLKEKNKVDPVLYQIYSFIANFFKSRKFGGVENYCNFNY